MSKIVDYKTNIVKNGYSESSGSTAVVNENIKMEMNEFGEYVERIIDEDKITEDEIQTILKVAPMSDLSENENVIGKKLFSQLKGIQYNRKIGYYLSLYAGHVTEGEYREVASSGGMGTWILKELFEKDLIDGVIHVKKNTDSEKSVLFKYDISNNLEEIRQGAKTKYYPVEFSEVIQKVKAAPGRYAIVGIPSFVMAIRLLAQEDEIVNESIRYTIGLVCGHQKSARFADYMAWQAGIKPGELESIDFRKKLTHGKANQYAVEMTGTVDGEKITITKPTKELLGQNWGQGFFKSKTSDFTDDVMNETADLTIGDAWLPEYVKDNKGSNIVIVRNPDILNIIEDGMKHDLLKLDRLDEESIIRSQSSHFTHTQEELPYRLFKKKKAGEWYPEKRMNPSKDMPFLRRKVQDLREILFMESHSLFKEAVEKDDLTLFNDRMKQLDHQYKRLYQMISLKEKGFKTILKKYLKR